ncbi:MAG: hypothetical protein IPO87_06460 [Flavobacteriales bacterium]|nr:hypothetical protein [Flavobacteriales bacterium]
MNATKAQTYTEMLLDTEAFDRHWARCYAQFKQVLQGLSAPSRRLVWQITYQYNDLQGMARVIASGFTLGIRAQGGGQAGRRTESMEGPRAYTAGARRIARTAHRAKAVAQLLRRSACQQGAGLVPWSR